MRFASTRALFVTAPFVLALTGCVAGPSWLVGEHAGDPAARAQRIWQAAQQYEAQGQYQSAYYLYHKLVHQQPRNQQARERLQLVAERINEGATDVRLASGRSSKDAQTALKLLAAIQAEEREKMLTRHVGGSTSQPFLAENHLRAESVAPSQPATITRPLAHSAIPSNPVVLASTPPDLQQPASPAPLPPIIDEQPATEASVNESASTPTPEAAWWMADAAEETTPAAETQPRPVPESLDLSPTSELASATAVTVVHKSDELPKVIPAAKTGWQPTSLARHCGELSPDVAEAVALLDSSLPETQIDGLQQLSRAGERARPAAVAVRSLLKSDDPIISADAAETLHAIANDAEGSVNTLIRLLTDSDESVVCLACYLLGKLGPEAIDAQPDLEIVLTESSGITALHAAEALLRIAPRQDNAFSALSQALTSSDRQQRWFAALALGSVQGPKRIEAAVALQAALDDEGPEVRAAAALSLGGLGEQAAVAIDDLERIAQSDEQDVREAAATALACLKE